MEITIPIRICLYGSRDQMETHYKAEFNREPPNTPGFCRWWDDTPGYKQHLAYARLRAIEARRTIVRSANTGISAIINPNGEILERTNWWEPAVISGNVQTNDELTFYVKHGDYLGRIAAFLAPLLLLLTLVKSLNKTQQRLG